MPQWHLHVTVQPHWSWSLSDVASALQRDVERHGVKPVVITNHFRDPNRPSYKELIPTCHHEGDDASASRRIFELGVLLNNSGWRVRRLKIEGDPADHSVGRRALYFETHLRNPMGPEEPGARGLPIPRSTNARGDVFYTVRRPLMIDVYDAIDQLNDMYEYHINPRPHVEAAVLDTNPDLDHDWMSQ